MSVLNLKPAHFKLVKGAKDTMVLSTQQGLEGAVVVIFKMNGCQLFKSLSAHLNTLAHQQQAVKIAVADLQEQGNAIVKMSTNTTTPITASPWVILYDQGKPVKRICSGISISNISALISGYAQPSQIPIQQASAAPQMMPLRQTRQYAVQQPQNQLGGALAQSTEMLTPGGMVPYNTPWETIEST
jgi:thioredoxin-like negative regulator of GroEL